MKDEVFESQDMLEIVKPRSTYLLQKRLPVIIEHDSVRYPGIANIVLNLRPVPHILIRAYLQGSDFLETVNSKTVHYYTCKFPSLQDSVRSWLSDYNFRAVDTKRFLFDFQPTREHLKTTLKNKTALQRVQFELLNFPLFDWDRRRVCKRAHGSCSSQILRWGSLVAENWSIHISEHRWSAKNDTSLYQGTGYEITHTCVITRRDTSTFLPAEAEQVIEALQYFFSFAKGDWVTPIRARGYSKSGSITWREISLSRTSRWKFTSTWFNLADASVLTLAFPGFYKLWQNKVWKDNIKCCIDWYITSDSNQVDSDLIICQSALELLVWTYIVISKRLETPDSFNSLTAANRLRLMLYFAQIPKHIPPTMPLLSSEKWDDGPHAITSLRNAITHPTVKPDNKILHRRLEAVRLCQTYFELILLWLCNYNGRFKDRGSTICNGQCSIVPWARPTILTT